MLLVSSMDWMNFVKEHPGSLKFQRIGRSVYSSASNLGQESSTIINWFRETERNMFSN
ncbi:MAG: hypothetical protein PHX27_04255 [Candidatus ainarchaeum sp.]|nr:hypothetical protein [Candidatus ainarchaeum sp.]